MHIGPMLAGSGTIEEQVQQVVDAENDGFDAVWFGQIFNADVLTVIAIAGQRTHRIELGTSVVPTYVRHPFAMAQQAMTVQAASGGRFVLGLGLSHKPVVEDMWGLSYEHPARHMREYLSVLGPLVRDGAVGFKGEVFRTMGGIQVPGGRPVPVMIAALAPMMLKIAGTMTDGTITWMTGPKTLEMHIVPRLTAAAREAGRPQPRVAAGLPVCVTDDAEGAREIAAKAFAVYGSLPNYQRVLEKEGAAGPRDVAIVGNEAQVEAQLRGIASAGATDFYAPVFPDKTGRASVERTNALLKSLIGKI